MLRHLASVERASPNRRRSKSHAVIDLKPSGLIHVQAVGMEVNSKHGGMKYTSVEKAGDEGVIVRNLNRTWI